MQPQPDEFKDWMGHPVTEWIFAQCVKAANGQKAKWADLAWQEGQLDPAIFNEARVRADCYLALPHSSFEDWKAIDDSEA